jgi:hypothetical protein
MKENEVKIDSKDKHDDHRDDHHHEHPHEVKITINGKKYDIKSGVHTVAELKRLGHVPADEILSQFLHGQLVDLDDNAQIKIHGDETFASHVKSSGSS